MATELERLHEALAGRYAIEQKIGSGGMATVYLAEDTKHHRKVAVKVLRAEFAAEVGAERFLREIEIAAQLQHPHILPLYDSGHDRGLLYYVMPYVDGGSLRDRMKREERLPVDDAVRITRAVALALDYAHRRSVIHRDIKPENILLSEDQPVIADFGVAKAVCAGCDERGEGLTEIGLAVGTPAYMSPEQATAERVLDGRTDLYSLACVLFEALAGAPPFAGSTARATMALHAIQSAPSLRAKRADVPMWVDYAVAKALAKEPDDRYATALEFAEALSSQASGYTAAFRGVAGVGDTRTIAVLPFVNTSADPDNEYFSDGMTDELINALAKVEKLKVASRTSAFAFKRTGRDIREIGAMLNVAVVLEGTVRKAGDQIRITAQLTDVTDGRHLWSERYDRELCDVFQVQDEIARTIVATLRRTLVGDLGEPVPKRYTENLTAYSHYLRGRYHWNRRGQKGLTEAIRHFELAIAEDANYALAHTGLADSYALQLDYRGIPVAEGMQRAKAEALRALELDDDLAEAHTSLAWVTFLYEWDWETADREFRRAIELNPTYATAHQWYAWLLMALGRIEEALAEGRASLETDPASVSIRRTLGWLYYYARRPAEALVHLRHAVTLQPTAEESHRVLGLALTQDGQYQAAADAFREALALAPDSAYTIAGLAQLAAASNRLDEARRLMGELEARAAEGYVSPVAFATMHVALGNTDQAFEWIERAYQERRGWLVYLNVEPILDPLRGDARFVALVKRMRL
ncbi:MAG TPA: protein kinase [Gemmatimonadales bacterium]|nr:protein kinase [Gemmatimonadales bacterium]